MKQAKRGIKRKIDEVVGHPLRMRRWQSDSNHSIPKSEGELLTYAITLGDIEWAQGLIKDGACVNAVDRMFWRRTCLHLAVIANNLDMVKLLLGHPTIEPNIKDEIGKTALCYAQSREMLCLFLKHPKITFSKTGLKNLDDMFCSDMVFFNRNGHRCSLDQKLYGLLRFLGKMSMVCKDFSKEMVSAGLIPDMVQYIVIKGANIEFDLLKFIQKSYTEGISKGISLNKIRECIIADILEGVIMNDNVEKGL
jgi:hypothetical protein